LPAKQKTNETKAFKLECLSNAKTRPNIAANPMTCDRNMPDQ